MIRNYTLYSGCYHLFALNPLIPPFFPHYFCLSNIFMYTFIINPRIYHILKRHVFFLLIYFIKIYNLYFLFWYIISKVNIHYKRKKNQFRTICQTKNLTSSSLVKFGLKFDSILHHIQNIKQKNPRGHGYQTKNNTVDTPVRFIHWIECKDRQLWVEIGLQGVNTHTCFRESKMAMDNASLPLT